MYKLYNKKLLTNRHLHYIMYTYDIRGGGSNEYGYSKYENPLWIINQYISMSQIRMF